MKRFLRSASMQYPNVEALMLKYESNQDLNEFFH